MKKKMIFIIASFLAIGLGLAGAVTAYGFGGEDQRPLKEDMKAHFEQMQEIFNDGTYEDLEAFRESNDGRGGPRWIDSEEDFELFQKIHEIKKQYAEENGLEEFPRKRGFGGERGGFHNCPFAQGQ